MFCTKCGKELYEGDKFCGFCGAEVRNRIPSKNDEVVFNPPFKIEARKKTEEILKAVEARKEETAKKETVAFDWNLEGFPAQQPKKTEDVDFNWDSVLERRNSNQPEPAAYEEDSDSIEALEKEIFASSGEAQDDRFFTFNQKNDEFQKLLDKEKERVQNLEDEYNRQFAEMDYTWVPEVFPVKHRNEPKKESEAVLISVAQPVTPNTVDLTGESRTFAKDGSSEEALPPSDAPCEREPAGGEAEDAAPPASERLRYSDIFPRVNVPGDSDSIADHDRDEIYEKPVKKHVFLRILIAILIIALVAEGAVLAIKFFAPESKASQLIDDMTFKIVDLFTGNSRGNAENAQADDEDVMSAYMANIVAEKSADIKTIGTVIYNPELVYDNSKTYSFEEISSAEEFVDGQWEGMNATYGEKLIETIIKHYDEWFSTNTDKDLVGINTLEIGETKTGQSGFYTLCKVTFAKADGSETSYGQTVYTVISDELMVINEIKEESV